MKHKTITIAPTFEAWQAAARALLSERVPPDEVRWREDPDARPREAAAAGTARVPRAFMDRARQAAAGADPARWPVLYAVLWRLVHVRRDLLDDARDPDVRRLTALVSGGGGAAPFVPKGAGLDELRAAAARCRGCDLYRHATRAVFGRGPAAAPVVFVGEQPGEQEDLKGEPFVGPAGEVLDRVLAEVGLDRRRVYVTNVVKHFKFVQRGKRRIHETPRAPEINACRPWLEAELEVIQPKVLACLGATAARAIIGADFRLLRDHGRWIETRWSPKTIATLHPSAVLRGQDDDDKARLYALLRDDLRVIAAAA